MRYYEVVLDGVLHDSGLPGRGVPLRKSQPRFRLDLFIATVEALLKARKLRCILIHCKPSFRTQAYAGYQIIGSQLQRLAKSGKELWFYAEQYGIGELYLASLCSHRVIHPLGFVQALGLARPFLFFKKALQDRRLQVEVFRRGRYKGALDSLRNDRLDQFQREQYHAVLEGSMHALQDRILEGYACSREAMEVLTSGSILSAHEAVGQNWVTTRMSHPELIGDWRDNKHRPASLKVRDIGFGKGAGVAVLFLEGTLVTGRSRTSPVFGQSVGSDTACEQITRLERNRRVKAVIVRINSGGGSATASASIHDALARLRRKKPVVVSMGEIAASGGYWVATQAERLFVEPSTITGSIGVLMAIFNMREFLKSHGITEDIVKTHEHADLGSPLRKLTGIERQKLDEIVSKLYYAFLRRVAEFRNRSITDIDKLAEGRVWTGQDAVRLGLADELGGLSDAIEYVRRMHTGPCRVRYFPREKRSLLERLITRNLAPASLATAALPPASRYFFDELALLHGHPLALWEPLMEQWLGAIATELHSLAPHQCIPEAQRFCSE